MVYTTLFEPYQCPKLVPIEATVLRGARRLRLATPLRRKYADFVPKLWNMLAKLGYQKYLQKIYISIDSDTVLTSPYYQLPLVVAVLEAIGMISLRYPIHAIGRFMTDYAIYSPPVSLGKKKELHRSLFSINNANGIHIEQYLNRLHKELVPFVEPTYDIRSLFPGVLFKGSAIDFVKTPLSILKRIPMTTYNESTVMVVLRHKPIPLQRIEFLQTIPAVSSLSIEHKSCFCEQKKCRCTNKDRIAHAEQLLILKEINTRKRQVNLTVH